MHVHQESVAIVKRRDRFVVRHLGNDIDAVTVNYGYTEQPNVRKALNDLRRRGRIEIAAERWIIEVGEEDIIADPRISFWRKLNVGFFGWILKLSTPAHKYFGLAGDAAVSKEVIPVVFDNQGAKITLPELEIVVDSAQPSASL
jgi:KUP system potassium uptake protein